MIRALGGLLSAYHLSGDKVFLDKAVSIAQHRLRPVNTFSIAQHRLRPVHTVSPNIAYAQLTQYRPTSLMPSARRIAQHRLRPAHAVSPNIADAQCTQDRPTSLTPSSRSLPNIAYASLYNKYRPTSLTPHSQREQVAFQLNANHPLAESMGYIKFEGM